MNKYFKKITLLLPIILFNNQSLATGIPQAKSTVIKEESSEKSTALLSEIRNFKQLSPVFSSAGMPELKELSFLKQNGYQHIINLIPGNFDDEQERIIALNMSFEQIEVDWNEPKLADFQRFVELMKEYKQEKVLVHCRLNYRASAFAYLYQTTQLGVDEIIAKQKMHSVWQPEGIWLEFINMVQHHYQGK